MGVICDVYGYYKKYIFIYCIKTDFKEPVESSLMMFCSVGKVDPAVLSILAANCFI